MHQRVCIEKIKENFISTISLKKYTLGKTYTRLNTFYLIKKSTPHPGKKN